MQALCHLTSYYEPALILLPLPPLTIHMITLLLQINLIAPPQYVVTTTTLERTEGIARLNTALQVIRESIEDDDGQFNVKMEVCSNNFNAPNCFLRPTSYFPAYSRLQPCCYKVVATLLQLVINNILPRVILKAFSYFNAQH